MKCHQVIICTFWCFLNQHVVKEVASDCSDGADVAFMVDNADISPFKFRLQKDFIKEVMVKLWKKSSQFNAAIVLYNHEATVELNFAQTFEMNYFRNVLDNLKSQDHCEASLTRIDQAFQATSEHVYASHGGARLNTPKIAVLLTHSSSLFALEILPPRNASESLKQKGVRILIVGIAAEAYQQELHNITEDKDDLIVVKRFSTLPEMEDVLVDKICSAIDNPWIRFDESSVSLFAGESHVINCYTWSVPSSSVKWLRNGQELEHGDLNGTVNVSLLRVADEERITLELHFSKVDSGHAGNYTCEARNKYNTRRQNLTVMVSCPPSLPTVTAVSPSGDNNSVTLSCKVSSLDYQGRDLYYWKWKLNETDIQENGKYNMSYKIDPPNVCLQSTGWLSLRIKNFSNEDFGQYKCAVLSSNITLEENDINLWDTEIFNLPPPPKIVSADSDNCGRSVYVVWNSPYTEYELQLDSTNDRRQTAHNESHRSPDYHVFHGLKSNMIYEVKTRVRNTYGFGLWAKKVIRTIAERPDKFTVHASSFGCSVKLSWEPPPRKGCPVTRYTIHYRESVHSGSNRTAWQTKNMYADYPHDNKQFYQLWLECSRAYDIIVLGWNERGHSDFDEDSMVSVSTEKAGVPFKPSLKDVEDSKCGVFNVSWESPASDSGGGPITAYQAQVRMEHEDWHNCKTSSKIRSCLFTGLVNEAKYYVRVQAINRKGPSDWFNESIVADYTGPPEPPEIINNEAKATGRNVTVMWRRPSDNNCHITMYTLHYRIVGPVIKDENWSSVNIANTTFTRYELQLHYSKVYEVIVSAWNELGHSNSTEWYLSTAQDVPYPPTIFQTDSAQCNSINITWSPPTQEALGGPVTDYLAQIKRNGSKDPWYNCSSFEALRSTSCLFANLKKDTYYEVRVMAENSVGYSLPSHKLIKTKNTDRPDTPAISNTETTVPGCNVTITWDKPPSNGCPILFYTVQYKQKGPGSEDIEWRITNVTDSNVSHQKLALNCTTTYLFEVKAWNEEGGSHSPSKAWPITTGGGQPQAQRVSGDAPNTGSSQESFLTTSLVVACLVFLAVVLVIVRMHYKTRPKQSGTVKRTKKDIKVLELHEIHPRRTTFVAALGEGAFGRVHLATCTEGWEYFNNNQDGSRKMRQRFVAVKELHDNAGEEQRKEFLGEIQLMKQIGRHQNVLSFVGCWTTTKPLYLVIEYVAHGDLRQWLIRKRRQIINHTAHDIVRSKDNTEYAETKIQRTVSEQASLEDGHEPISLQENSVSSIARDVTDQSRVEFSNECEVPLVAFSPTKQERDDTTKRDDECSEDCESFHPADLLSFSWQIVRGMVSIKTIRTTKKHP
ncbi:receptor-type tyrosine-protein phosphatase F-like isoform X3 [Oculina patagonica]